MGEEIKTDFLKVRRRKDGHSGRVLGNERDYVIVSHSEQVELSRRVPLVPRIVSVSVRTVELVSDSGRKGTPLPLLPVVPGLLQQHHLKYREGKGREVEVEQKEY